MEFSGRIRSNARMWSASTTG